MGVDVIQDPADPRLDGYRNVPDHDLLARGGLFVAEGRLVVRRLLLNSDYGVRSVMVTPAARASVEEALAARPDVPLIVVPQPVMDGITGFNVHRGCLALGVRPASRDWRALARAGRRLVVLERIGNADNVGGIFRNAAAFAADAVLLGPACADPLYRKAIRTSMGAALTLPFAAAGEWPGTLRALHDEGWTVMALTLSPDAPPLREVVRHASRDRVAIVLGHEGDGLTAAALEACAHHARIPMSDRVDSLNVATAAAIALYELAGGS